MRFLFILYSLVLFCVVDASTPLNFSLSYHGGYDDNVMRFSSQEIENAASDVNYMGGAKKLDSYINRFQINTSKTLLTSGSKEIEFSSMVSVSDYIHNVNKDYWSGSFTLKYRWGAYRNIKYSLRHLNSYYLRHYIDRDVSLNELKPCNFSDNDQFLNFTNRLDRRYWYSVGAGFLQRYYDNPFSEFDLDIFYLRLKINKKIKKVGTIAFQMDRGTAKNISFQKTAVSSDFDRSYETIEWYVPVKFKSFTSLFDHVGFSFRQELRYYKAEAANDVLHSGRDHTDSKLSFWVDKELWDDLSITISARFRSRNTDSAYEWVRDLKSFNQTQLWCKIKWGFSYDKY